MKLILPVIAIFCWGSMSALTTQGQQSPVDSAFKLQKIEGQFGLPDGAAWDGRSALFIPDVKAQTLYRYVPRTKKLQVIKKGIGRISATFFQHGRLYLSDNGNQSISFLEKGKKQVVFDFATINKKLRPNDLVIDNSGGIYVTFTPQNQVHYISADGKHSIAVQQIQTPNGITLSPDGKTLYVSAFVPKEIWSYQIVAPGKVAEGKKFAVLPASEGRGADGMAIDRAENVYCTGPTGVTIWNTNGELLDKVVTPSKPINCIFGDQDMQTLYISCFDGVYAQKMKISGKAPQPPIREASSDQNASRPATAIPSTITPLLDVVYAKPNGRKLMMDLFIPQGKQSNAAIVVVHGGGWRKGDKTKFRALAIRLARSGFVTAAIEYRLAGEARFPAAIEDCFAAVRFLRANAKQYKIDPNRIGAVGGSAGGHLVGLMATAAENPEFQPTQDNSQFAQNISAAIVLAGPLQIASGQVADRSRTVKDSNCNVWLGGTIDELKSLYRLADAHEQISKRTPPILFQCGELDRPERNEPSRLRLKELGVWTDIKVYQDGKHGCWNQNPWFSTMSADMVEFFDRQLNSGQTPSKGKLKAQSKQ